MRYVSNRFIFCNLCLRSEAKFLFIGIKCLFIFLKRVDVEDVGERTRVVPAWHDLASTQRLRFQKSLNSLGCRSCPHLLQILDCIFMLNDFDELFINFDVIDAHVLTILERNLDAEFV